MRLFISTAAALVLSVGALVACSPQDGSAPAAKTSGTSTAAKTTNQSANQTTKPEAAQNPSDTRRISVEETQKAVEAGSAVIVDVRDTANYKTSHIKGAINVPLQQFDERIGELPKDKLIVTYCA